MQNSSIKLLEVVALLEDCPGKGLVSGQVGTVIEMHTPDAFEVEFLDSHGNTIALVPLRRAEVLLLRHEPVVMAS